MTIRFRNNRTCGIHFYPFNLFSILNIFVLISLFIFYTTIRTFIISRALKEYSIVYKFYIAKIIDIRDFLVVFLGNVIFD